ncbi:subclass B1 metallo-beta-lactamase [Spirosoma aureum]|uniref:beta-lactamase n=1 Tax=Spirosoma aureum TaxID=2692134 RepID=A0A6G9AH72_9BACT|nr:subclass B1 metallo-beta-lactamase [Spirosoma aureum]QIP11659.1 subclass B1 metallo-beta-lactamase [Spirosoma aureum]
MRYLCFALISFLIGQSLFAQSPEFRVESIKPSIYVHTSYMLYSGQPFPSNGLVIETKKGVVLVDTPWDTLQTRQLLDWISTNLKRPVLLAIITHAHDDRLAGTELLRRQGTRVICTPLTARLAKAKNHPVPDAILPNDTTLYIGGVRIETYFPGPGHSPDNIVVWLPKQKLLFGGCLVKSVEASGLGNIADADLSEWPATIRRVHERFPKIDLLVPGHQSWKTNDTSIAIPFGHPALQRTINLLDRKGG